MTPTFTLLEGNCLTQLKTLANESVQCCVTSPPYFGLRDYGVAGQIGMERTPDEYVAALVAIFSEVKRALKPDGVLWLNLGDSYAASGKGGNPANSQHQKQKTNRGSAVIVRSKRIERGSGRWGGGSAPVVDCKAKDLVGIPWLVAFALRADGWYLRSEITWCKKVPMPESVRDRPTSATEKIFLLTKSPKYFYNSDAVKNPPSESWKNDKRWQTGSTQENLKIGYEAAKAQNPKQLHRMFDKQRGHSRRHAGFNDRWDHMPREQQCALGSNMRNYWILGPQPFKGAHFATFPTEVPRKCIMAGSRPGDVVLDPFAGSGTTLKVALELGRSALGIELNPQYAEIIRQRCAITLGLALT